MFSRTVREIRKPVSIEISDYVKKLKLEGKDIIDLAIGQPDLPVDKRILNAVNISMTEGFTGYTESKGIYELRLMISRILENKHKVFYSPDNILVTPGGKQAIYYALKAILNPGDEVIIVEPCWLSYKELVKLVGGKPKTIPTIDTNNFIPTIEQFEKNISRKTKLIIMNNPVNPSGIIWPNQLIESIATLCVKNNVFVLTDDIYDDIIFDQMKIKHISTLKNMFEKLIIVHGFSKSYSMTGFRIGYIAACLEVINEIQKVHEQLATCAPSISQFAAIEALKLPQDVLSRRTKIFQNRKESVVNYCKFLNIRVIEPNGGIYCLINVSQISYSSIEACKKILELSSVATVPGIAYGESAEGYVRISLSQKKEILIQALDNIHKLMI